MLNKKERKILVYDEPTAMCGSPARVMLSQRFVLNNRHQYTWRIVGVKHCDVDEHYITYTACSENNQGWVNVVVPRKWSMTMTMRQDEQFSPMNSQPQDMFMAMSLISESTIGSIGHLVLQCTAGVSVSGSFNMSLLDPS
jgi:hypothetical protein